MKELKQGFTRFVTVVIIALIMTILVWVIPSTTAGYITLFFTSNVIILIGYEIAKVIEKE